MVLNRINLLIAGGNEGSERGRQVLLQEEGEPGAGMVTASLALPPGLHLLLVLPGFFLFFFLVVSETGNEGWTARRNSRPVFNVRIIKFPPINPLPLIILKGLTIRRQYSAIDSHSCPMATSLPAPARACFWGVPPLLCGFLDGAVLLPSPSPRAQAAPR